jgi:hypothetical protein
MTYYLFPRANIDLLNDIKIELSISLPPNILSPSFLHYFSEIVNITSNDLHYLQMKKELHTYYNIISNNVLSKQFRVNSNDYYFYEYIEIIHMMHLNIYLSNNFHQIRSFHMEKTNGSSKAFQFIRKNYQNDIFIDAYTYSSRSFSYPPSEYSHFKQPQTIFPLLLKGEPELQPQEKYQEFDQNIEFNSTFSDYNPWLSDQHIGSMDIITGDLISKSTYDILLEFIQALYLQKKKGILIWKIENCFSTFQLDIVYWLSSFYEKMYFIKPTVMDICDSTKYIVCKGFLHDNRSSIFPFLFSFYKYIWNIKQTKPIYHIHRILKIQIPLFFISKIEEVNYIYGQAQLEQIHYILLLIHHKHKYEKIQNAIKMNSQKCIEWCMKFQVPYLVNSYMEQPCK